MPKSKSTRSRSKPPLVPVFSKKTQAEVKKAFRRAAKKDAKRK